MPLQFETRSGLAWTGSQPPLFSAHEVLGLQPVTPSPRKSAGQAEHEKLPGELVQVVSGSQTGGVCWHSLISVQVTPSPW